MSPSDNEVRHDVGRLSDDDLFLFNEGSHFALWEKLGAHPCAADGVAGTSFAVWAPDAERVTVAGDFNGWNKDSHPLSVRWDGSGIWEGFLPGVGAGAFSSFESGVEAMVQLERAFEPDAHQQRLYADRFEKYRQLWPGLRDCKLA